MKRRIALGGLATLLTVLSGAACTVLVAGEAQRPPPPGLAEPVLTPIDIPFVHRWSRDTSHPLLAAAAIDIDGDGRDEVFLGGSDGQADALIAWRDGKLADIAAQAGLGDTTATHGALSLDLDGDGQVDLLTAGHAGLVVWLNKSGRFEPRPIALKLPDDAVPMAVTAGDYDRDGRVDLYLSMFVAARSFRSPVFNDPAHAKRNILLRNEGNLQCRDVTDAVTVGLQNTFTASFVDLDRDGWLDLALAQNTGEAEILRNLDNGSFVRVALRTGFGFWMGLAFGDLHGDGDPDIFFSNAGNSIPAIFVKGDRRDDQPAALEWLLLRNDGGMRFTGIIEPSGATGFGFAWGGVFEDINLDGVLDLLVAENYVKWPVHRLFKLPGKGANMDGPARAYLNRSAGRFVAVRLPDDAASIGARVRLEGVRVPVRQVIAGEGLTSDRTTQHTIGMPADGPAPTALVVEWPDGRQTRMAEPPLGKPLRVPAPA
ncbi:MAG: VCBS repeat-containing protein [Rhizobacter sp.]|nr:VCBS repeat-containing protein [Rhizobacter sp.]